MSGAGVPFAPPEPPAGTGVAIAVIDSGIAAGHPHIGAVVRGVSLVGDDPRDIGDRLGHGTAVAAAILEKVPGTPLLVVRVLDRQLATSARLLAQAITWAASRGARLINLSLGTTNAAHVPLFESAIAAAVQQGALVVAALGEGDTRWLPGSLPGVVGVMAAAEQPRFALSVIEGPLGRAVAASPFPRPIPGVDAARNLSGVSFAVANATGLLARVLAVEPGLRSADDLMAWLAATTVPAAPPRLILPDADAAP